ncbi:hypothetical protein GCM10010466_13720 [Planomonospora alba]|uniref:Uncharacterized protein n=1 Tax=Planomonospora alba TaxID=161354 RepID=A0ABP6MTL7_9ACTN
MPGSKRRVVAEAKDLKPRRVRVFKYNENPLVLTFRTGRGGAGRGTRAGSAPPVPRTRAAPGRWAASDPGPP